MYVILFSYLPLIIYYIVRDASAKGVYEGLTKYEQDKHDKT